MNKPFYMYMNVQGMGRNVFTCLITIFLLVSCQSYKKVPLLAGCGSCGTDSSTGKFV